MHLIYLKIQLLSAFIIFGGVVNASAHVHNEGKMNLVVEDNKFVLSLVFPAGDIVGFERAPKNKEEKLQVDRAISRLKDMTTMFSLPEDAKCKLMDQIHISAEVLLKVKKDSKSHKSKKSHKRHEHDKTHKHKDHKHEHGDPKHVQQSSSTTPSSEHSDIEVSYMLECQQIANLKKITVLLFEAFPKVHKLHAQFVSEGTQTAMALTPKKNIFVLKR